MGSTANNGFTELQARRSSTRDRLVRPRLPAGQTDQTDTNPIRLSSGTILDTETNYANQTNERYWPGEG